MARFRAYDSDSDDSSSLSSSSDSEIPNPKPPALRRRSFGAYNDDDDDLSSSDSDASRMDEDELVATPKKPAPKANGVRKHPPPTVESASSSRSSSRTPPPPPPPQPSQPPQSKTRPDPTVILRAQQLGVEPGRVHVMQASLFRMPEEEAALKAASQTKRPLHLQLNRKHSRGSDGGGLGTESVERPSFNHAVEPEPYRPAKYARVENAVSSVSGQEAAMVDAGLAFGRSFRVGWGPNGTLVHLGRICGPSSTLKTAANTSEITISSVPLFPEEPQDGQLEQRLQRLLRHQLSHTERKFDAEGVPFASPSRSLNFASICSLYAPQDRSWEASLFRLGHALFDEMDLHLPDSAPPDVRKRIEGIRRKAALSAWLEEAVSPAVDADLRANFAASAASAAFTHLSGNQIEKACDAAMDGGNLHLASLIAQSGGDAEFRIDLQEQLRVWREQKVDVHMDEHVRKLYALLAGIVEVLEGSNGKGIERCPDINVADGLDWKRTFGLYLWHGMPLDASVAEVYEAYDEIAHDASAQIAPPQPWYSESSPPTTSRWNLPAPQLPSDALYSLIRLFAIPSCSLSDVLNPLSFGPSPVDYSFPWHLYILFSRCLRLRDFADRGDPGPPGDETEGEEVEGHSPTADLLASSYAHQLEQRGMLQDAAFVLMHIEGSAGRRKAIMDLLTRHGSEIGEDRLIRGLHSQLKIPLSWIHEAKAICAISVDDMCAAYDSYMDGQLWNAAHDVAVRHLAPDAVIRRDYQLLQNLLAGFAIRAVDGWHVRGKIFLDYVDVVTRLDALRAQVEDPDAVADAVQMTELEDICRGIPKLIDILPDVLSDRTDPRHNVALSMMTSDLMSHLSQIRPLSISNGQPLPSSADEAAKLRHIQSAAHERFMLSITESDDDEEE
ncbi:hypothetical protein PUNSTDRAFT_102949 [Punctularia strigosozonata HHB-11173 SS5]|uniref:uncharacterized protein n=1 Tax=Punctularia strigosozonata (strain HHB-11173) TaxID=741275 RepID=UPI00044171C5|nr:uncharacterized protein PUNSTDRAFT_102949 [Punctularia strigosozonata HHB-11173 SS5]EIN08184.1 hypothetical protein PUNSTDRAFT_102949 [Punctularia strigosozonata HHB-11173 SS5]